MSLSAFVTYSKTQLIEEPAELCVDADSVGWLFSENCLRTPHTLNDFTACSFKTSCNYSRNHHTWSPLLTPALKSGCSTEFLVFHSSQRKLRLFVTLLKLRKWVSHVELSVECSHMSLNQLCRIPGNHLSCLVKCLSWLRNALGWWWTRKERGCKLQLQCEITAAEVQC